MHLLLNKTNLCFLLIIFISLGLRLFRLNFPDYPYFDEIYHVPAARLIAANDSRAYEWWHQPILSDNFHDWLHPPAAKLIQAGSIKLLGNRPLAWRLPSVLAGTGLIAAVYFLTQQIFKPLYPENKVNKLSILAAFITAASGLVLVQSRIAMNDIFLVLWLVLSLAFLYRWRPSLLLFKLKSDDLSSSQSPLGLILTGLFLGLALATKWSALFLIAFLFLKLFWIFIENKAWRLLPITVFSLLILPMVIYLTSYSQMFMQGKDLSYFINLHQQIARYQLHRSEGHLYSSTPAEWFINLRPAAYWTGRYTAVSDQEKKPDQSDQSAANIYALGNPLLHIVGQLSLIYILGLIIRDMVGSNQAKVYLNLFMLYSVVWLPWLASPRVMFYHHYLPAIPLLCILISEFINSHVGSLSRIGQWILLGLIVISFAAFYPHWTGLAVSKSWAETLYFGLQTWR